MANLKKLKSFVARLISGFSLYFTRERILKFLKEKAVESLFKKILGGIAMGGIKGWLVRFVITEVMEEVEDELVEPLLRKIGLVKDIHEGKTIYKRVEDAENRDDWRDSVRDT